MPPFSKFPAPATWLGLAAFGLLALGLLGHSSAGPISGLRWDPPDSSNRRRRRYSGGRRRLALALALATVLVWVACGGSPPIVTHSAGTPAGTYTLKLTGTAGSMSHSATVAVNVNSS